MRIAINALPAIVGAGVTFYSNALHELARIDPNNKYVLIVRPEQLELFGDIPPEIEVRIVGSAPRSFTLRFPWEQVVLPVLLRKWKIDLLYTQGNVTSLFSHCPSVVTVTGANPYSELRMSPLSERIRNGMIRAMSVVSARRAARVVFISDDSRVSISRKLGIPLAKTDVVYYGWRPPSHQERRADSGREDVILTVSVLWRHKNLERLMRAFDLLVRRRNWPGRLIIAGAPHDEPYFRELLTARDALSTADRIEFTGRIPQAQLVEHYERCRIFVFPSLEETLGLPLLEAMGHGVPVAASGPSGKHDRKVRFSPFQELAGDAAVYFDPFDEESISSAMETLLEDPALREKLVRAGIERVTRFTWEETARGLLRNFQQAVHGRSSDQP